MTFGKIIREKRQNLGLPVADLAVHLNIPLPYLTELEEDRAGLPQDELLEKLSAYFSLPSDLIFCLAGRLPPLTHQNLLAQYESDQADILIRAVKGPDLDFSIEVNGRSSALLDQDLLESGHPVSSTQPDGWEGEIRPRHYLPAAEDWIPYF